MSEDVALKVDGLEKLLKALKAKPPKARVGILGGKTHRNSQGQANNAEIGAAHEYGSPARGLPQRSFLRVPLSELLQKSLERSGAFDKDVLSEVIKSGTITPWMRKVAAVAEDIVLGAFGSKGYGKWPSWRTPNYSNNTGQVLVDTTQLRNSITSEVQE